MADTNTPNILLLLPDLNDTFNFGAHVEANFTTIDGLMGAVDCTSTSRPTNTYKGQIIYEHDSLRYAQNTGTKSSAAWTYMSHQAMTSLSSSRPTSGLTQGEQLFETDNNLSRFRSSGAWLPNFTSCTSGARPSNPVTGDVALESNTSRVIQWTGSTWLQTCFANWVTTSSTRPGAPFTGLEIFETDTGLSAVYNGSAYTYGVQQAATTQLLGGTTASVTFSSIPSSLTNLGVVWSARGNSGNASDSLLLRFNADSANNYGSQIIEGNGATASASTQNQATASSIIAGRVTGGSATAGFYSGGRIDIPGWNKVASGRFATTIAAGYVGASTGGTGQVTGTYGGTYNASAQLTSLTLLPAAGSFLTGSQFSLYAYQ